MTASSAYDLDCCREKLRTTRQPCRQGTGPKIFMTTQACVEGNGMDSKGMERTDRERDNEVSFDPSNYGIKNFPCSNIDANSARCL